MYYFVLRAFDHVFSLFPGFRTGFQHCHSVISLHLEENVDDAQAFFFAIIIDF